MQVAILVIVLLLILYIVTIIRSNVKVPQSETLIDVTHKLFLYKQMERISKSGLWELRVDTNKLLWSDGTYEIFGLDKQKVYDLQEIMKKSIPESQHKEINGKLYNSMTKGESYNIVHDIKCKGKIKKVKGSAKPLYDGEQIVSIIGVVTEL